MPHKTIEARRAYARKWAAAHPGYGAEQSRKRRERHPTAAREEYLKHKEGYVARSKNWQAKNPDKAKESKRKTRLKMQREKPEYLRQKTKEWRERNPERYRLLSLKNRRKNRDKLNAQRRARAAGGNRVEEKARRRARVLANEFSDCTQRIRLLRLMPFCQYCFRVLGGKVRRTIDHVIPVNRGGGHVPHNLVAACGACNSSKADKLLTEWLGPIMEAA